MSAEPRLTLIHDWLTTWGGGEQVLEAALETLGPAPIHTMVYRPEVFRQSSIGRQDIRTSFIQRLPRSRANHRLYLPLMPLAAEQFDLRGFDLVLSSSHVVAHGVLTGPNQLHLSYTHAPARYAWSLYREHLETAGLRRGITSWAWRLLMHYLRLWDSAAAHRVDAFIANSRWTADNIWRAYRRRADVIYPPVDIDSFQPLEPREDYYLTVSRLVPYKRVDLIVEAFSRLGLPLRIVGTGPEMRRLSRIARGNVEFLGWQSKGQLQELMGRARAFVYAAVEDFGITLVEAQAAGCPVIAYGRGGARETVLDGETGILFKERSGEGILQAVRAFGGQSGAFDSATLRRNAIRFGKDRFKKELADLVHARWTEFQNLGRGERLS